MTGGDELAEGGGRCEELRRAVSGNLLTTRKYVKLEGQVQMLCTAVSGWLLSACFRIWSSATFLPPSAKHARLRDAVTSARVQRREPALFSKPWKLYVEPLPAAGISKLSLTNGTSKPSTVLVNGRSLTIKAQGVVILKVDAGPLNLKVTDGSIGANLVVDISGAVTNLSVVDYRNSGSRVAVTVR